MKQKKIILLPLDERPCNYRFPEKLMQTAADYTLRMPDASILGRKKQPADREKIDAFLDDNADADIAILSIDMLLYGGLLPGRLHHDSMEMLLERLQKIADLRRKNPAMKVYAFNLIMRCPQYSSDDEEPAYYGTCGREIFLLGAYRHKEQLGILTEDERVDVAHCERVTAPYLDDYLARRAVNLALNRRVIDLVGDTIDFLIIPQDDSSVYGFTAVDQQQVRDYVREKRKQLSVAVYPGADEVALTLLARAVAADKGVTPTVSVFYSSVGAPYAVPIYEDRVWGESIKNQIHAVGGVCVEGAADLTLAVNAPYGDLVEADAQHTVGRSYRVDRSLPAFVERIRKHVGDGMTVAVADVAYGNGGDLELAQLLDDAGLSFRIAGYAGWNTSGNTLGTVLAQMVLYMFYGDTAAHRRFSALRYYEDVAFCACARQQISWNLPDGATYCDLKNRAQDVAAQVRQACETCLRAYMPRVAAAYGITRCAMPWNRMFETEIDIDAR